jgi:hypothetical protein
MAESIKQKLGFFVAAMMVAAALAVLNLGSPAGAQQQGCGDGGGGGGGGGGTPSASPSPTESEEPFPPSLPPILPEESESSPSPTETSNAARKCNSDISLNYQGPTKKKPSRRQFTGKVSSAEDECEVGRKVTLKKQKSGADRTVDTTVTNNKGGFKMPAKRANGKYYVETPKENVVDDDGRISCGAAKSKTVKV